MQKIADADTLVKKRAAELKVMNGRLNGEKYLREHSVDEYGMDCINTMIVDINAEYAAMGVGSTHDAGVVDTEGDEDAEEEDSGSDHEPRTSKR
jgi:hypothetical protein